jgi:hypothetical protein
VLKRGAGQLFAIAVMLNGMFSVAARRSRPRTPTKHTCLAEFGMMH